MEIDFLVSRIFFLNYEEQDIIAMTQEDSWKNKEA